MEVPDYEEEKTFACGCPGSMEMDLGARSEIGDQVVILSVELRNWPVQLQLLNPNAPYLKNSAIDLRGLHPLRLRQLPLTLPKGQNPDYNVSQTRSDYRTVRGQAHGDLPEARYKLHQYRAYGSSLLLGY